MDRVLAIYDSDIIYATRFSLYFKKKQEFDYEISAFTKKESLVDFLAEHTIEILLLGEDIPPEELPESKIRWRCHLTEHPPNRKHQEHPEIYKYQPAKEIMAEVLSGYSKVKEDPQSSNASELQIISVFSPIPNAAKLAFAWSVSMLLSEQNKVLFVPMELLPVPVLALKDNDEPALSEFIYYLKENPKMITKLKDLIRNYGKLSYLSGITHGLELLSLNKEDIGTWLELMKKEMDYQIIIFYHGYYSETAMELLCHSNRILLPAGSTQYEKAQWKEWEQQRSRSDVLWKEENVLRFQLPEEDFTSKPIRSLQELQACAAWAIAKQVLEH